ncbi:hypothetical protein KR018_006016, partial [Drosophila ironensis]
MKDCITILDGEYQILRVTPDLSDETLELLVHISLNQEFSCLAVGIRESPLGSQELRRLMKHILSLGVSFAIRHVKSDRIVAAIASLIYNPSRNNSYDNVITEFTSSHMIKFLTAFEDLDNTMEVYKGLKSWIEMEYLATLPEFRCRGLGYILCQHTMDFGKVMAEGNLPPEVFSKLPKEIQVERPEAIITNPTSITSQKFCSKLGMQVAETWGLSDLKAL